jgi:hypothetical protein
VTSVADGFEVGRGTSEASGPTEVRIRQGPCFCEDRYGTLAEEYRLCLNVSRRGQDIRIPGVQTVGKGIRIVRPKAVPVVEVPLLRWHGSGDHRDTQQAKVALSDVF